VTNTYEDAAEAEADRAQQLRLLAALGAWDRALRRDELAAWCIQGTRGSIYTSGDGKTGSRISNAARPGTGRRCARSWPRSPPSPRMATRKASPGCTASPPPEHAEVIREALGIRKRVAVSSAWRERLRGFAFGSRPQGEPVSGARSGGTGRPRVA
jgi:hypothetical protein